MIAINLLTTLCIGGFLFRNWGCEIQKILGILFGLIMLVPVSATAECTSTSEITKCARFPDFMDVCLNYGLDSLVDIDGLGWTIYYNDIPITGTSDGVLDTRFQSTTTCTFLSPFTASLTTAYDGGIIPRDMGSGHICIDTCSLSSSFSTTSFSTLPGDVCPDGFFTVPYEVSCGTDMVNITSDIPNCSDDTSGEYCLIPAGPTTVPCNLGISMLRTETGLSIPLFAEKYTSPAIHIGYNGGTCYADLTIGQEINAINIKYNGTIYHASATSSGGGNTGGDSGDTDGEEVFND